MLAKVRLAVAALIIAACSSDEANSPTSGTVTQWIVDQILMPTNGSLANSFAYDLNGDGDTDNAFGNVIAALSAAGGLDLQAGMDAGISDGDIVQLIRFQSDDATLTADAAAGAAWYVGDPTLGFTTDAHQIDDAYAGSTFVGVLSGHDYSSRNPATTTQPVAAYLPFRLFAGGPLAYLPLNGVQVEWTFSGTTGIASGKIRGSIRETDMNNVFVPALVDAFNTMIQADTTSENARALQSLFDEGGCAGAVANDYILTVCEVATTPLMQTLLRADVQIYNAGGNYQPSAANANPNAISVGFGFTAVRTTF